MLGPWLFLAQLTAAEWTAPLMQFGIGGAVLAWFMLIVTPKLSGIEASQDRTAKAVLLLTIAIEDASVAVKARARELLQEIENKKK